MHRCAMTLLLSSVLAVTSLPGHAQVGPEASHKVHKTKKPKNVLASPSLNRPDINVPSTDFSTIERSDQEPAERSRGGTMRPVINDSGQPGMGMGF